MLDAISDEMDRWQNAEEVLKGESNLSHSTMQYYMTITTTYGAL